MGEKSKNIQMTVMGTVFVAFVQSMAVHNNVLHYMAGKMIYVTRQKYIKDLVHLKTKINLDQFQHDTRATNSVLTLPLLPPKHSHVY